MSSSGSSMGFSDQAGVEGYEGEDGGQRDLTVPQGIQAAGSVLDAACHSRKVWGFNGPRSVHPRGQPSAIPIRGAGLGWQS